MAPASSKILTTRSAITMLSNAKTLVNLANERSQYSQIPAAHARANPSDADNITGPANQFKVVVTHRGVEQHRLLMVLARLCFDISGKGVD